MDVDWDGYDDDDYDDSCGENDAGVGEYDGEDFGGPRISDEESEDIDEEEEVDEYVKDEVADNAAEIDVKAEKLSPDMRQAYNVVCHLMSPDNHLHNWPFMTAVDSKNGALWDYDTIVKDPVWLKQVRDDLLDGKLETVTEVFRRLRLMFRNCYRYNGPQHSVTRRALRLEHIMEQQIELMEPRLADECSLAVTEGEEAVVDQKIVNRRRNPRSKTHGFFSHVLHWVRHERADREKECRRQQLESKRQKRQEKEQRVVDWESRLMASDDGHRLRTMWQIPQMAQFIHLSLRALHIFEVPLYEMERMFLVPQSSETLAILMSSLVSPPLTRIKLVDLPPMPYSVWTEKLAARVQHWYRVYAREKSRPDKLFDSLGIEPAFWHVLGARNPFESRLFHEFSFYERVCMVKALCDFLFHIHKTVQECVTETAELEPRETLLGTDRQGFEYIHLPHLYVKDVRVYRRRPWGGEGGGDTVSMDDIKDPSSRCNKRRHCVWNRVQLGIKRRTAARARNWSPPESGAPGAGRFLCLGAEFTALDGAEDGDEAGANGFLMEEGPRGPSDAEDSDGADSCVSGMGSGQRRRSLAAGPRRGRGSRGGARRRGGRKLSAGLRVGPEVWCDVSSGEEDDVTTAVKTRGGGSRKSAGRGGARGPRGRGRGRGQASWREPVGPDVLPGSDDQRVRSPPRKRGRGSRANSIRKSFSVVNTSDPNVCQHCGMSLRSERSRKAHRCFKENEESVSPRQQSWSLAQSSVSPGADDGEVPVTRQLSTPSRRGRGRGRPAGKRGGASRLQRSWRNGLEQDALNQTTGDCREEVGENGVLDSSMVSLEETLRDLDHVNWGGGGSDRASLNNGSLEEAGAESDQDVGQISEDSEEEMMREETASGGGDDRLTPLVDVIEDKSRIMSPKNEPVDSPISELSRQSADAPGSPIAHEKLAVSNTAIESETSAVSNTAIESESSAGSNTAIESESSAGSNKAIKVEQPEDFECKVETDESEDCKPSMETDESEGCKPSIETDESEGCKPTIEAEDSENNKPSKEAESSENKPSKKAENSENGKPTLNVEHAENCKVKVESVSDADDKDSVSSVGVKANSDSNSTVAERCSSENGDDGEALPLPEGVSEPVHVPAADAEHFLLVADTFDSLRALVDKFSPNTESLACEVQLHDALTSLLQELEPLQAKINQSVCNMRKRLCQEWLSYLDRPPDYRDPNENAWKEPEVEPEPASKKRAKTPTPPPSSEPEQNGSDGEWGDGRRRTRSRRAKRKPVNYCVDGGEERRRAPGARAQQGDDGSLQVSSRGRVRRVRKMADFDYNEVGGQCELSDEGEEEGVGARAAGPRGSWRRKEPADDGDYIEPLPAWNSDLASSLSGSVEARVSQIRGQLQSRPRPPTPLRPAPARKIVVSRSGAGVTVGGMRPPLAADKYVLRMGEDGAMYMEKVGAVSAQGPAVRLATPSTPLTTSRVAVMVPCRDPSGSANKVLVPVSGSQAQTIAQTGTLLGCLTAGPGAVTALPLGSVPVSAVGAQLIRFPLVSGSSRPLLPVSQPVVSPAQSPMTRVALRVVNSQAPAAGVVVAPSSVSAAPKHQGPPPPMVRAPRLISSTVRFVNSPTAPAPTPSTATIRPAGAAPVRTQSPVAPRAAGPVQQQQGKVVVIRSGGEQKLGVLLGNGQVVQLSEAQANAVRKQAEKRNKTLPDFTAASVPSSSALPASTAPVLSSTVGGAEGVATVSSSTGSPAVEEGSAADSTT